jgi:hypothetical protein
MANSVNPFSVKKRTYFLTRIYEALDAIQLKPDIEHWRTIADVINLLTTFVSMEVLEDSDKIIQQAKDVVKKTFESGNSSLSSVDSSVIIRQLVDSLSDAVEVLPERVVIRAHRLTEKRVQSILNGHRQHGDIVI